MHGSTEMEYKQSVMVAGPSKLSFGMKLEQQQQEHLESERTGRRRRVCLLPHTGPALGWEPCAAQRGEEEDSKTTYCARGSASDSMAAKSVGATQDLLCFSLCIFFGCSSTAGKGTNSHCKTYFTE